MTNALKVGDRNQSLRVFAARLKSEPSIGLKQLYLHFNSNFYVSVIICSLNMRARMYSSFACGSYSSCSAATTATGWSVSSRITLLFWHEFYSLTRPEDCFGLLWAMVFGELAL